MSEYWIRINNQKFEGVGQLSQKCEQDTQKIVWLSPADYFQMVNLVHVLITLNDQKLINKGANPLYLYSEFIFKFFENK